MQRFHCTIHKAASTWFRDLFRDPIVILAAGRPEIFHYETDLKRSLYENYCRQTRIFFPENSIVTNIYASQPEFSAHSKGDKYKGFWMQKDPREIIISSYWSWKVNHPSGHPNRDRLERLNDLDGMLWVVEELHYALGVFDAMESWIDIKDSNFISLKVEEFFPNLRNQLWDLFGWLEIPLSTGDYEILLNKYSFERISGGRKPGQQDIGQHFRVGRTGTWKGLPEQVIQKYYDLTGNLTERLGYET